MSENDWNKVLEAEDRIIDNSDRKHRYHFNSLEAMSEELVYQESMAVYREHNPVELPLEDSFIDRIKDKKLKEALRRLTPKQQRAVDLAYWQGYKGYEIAEIMGCTPANVSILLDKALRSIEREMAK